MLGIILTHSVDADIAELAENLQRLSSSQWNAEGTVHDHEKSFEPETAWRTCGAVLVAVVHE